ncbi:salicylate hydroxylase [Mycobacterium sp. 1100029.7]|nr:salicylate hydroxylase [Mycobacterium sp. 1100029.7]
MNLTVAVVGGGLGGLTCAAALQASGVEVTVYEKARHLTEIGAGLVIGRNGLRALASVGLDKKVLSIASPIQESSLWTWQGEKLAAPAGWPVVTHPDGAPTSWTVHRGELQAVLKNSLPPAMVQLGHNLVALTETDNDVQLEFANGSTARADVVIGADGIHSVVRNTVAQPSKPVSEGVMAYRALVPAERLRHVDVLAMQMWLGPGKSFLVYPASSGRLLNVVGFVPNSMEAEESWTAPGEVSELAAEYAGWDAPVQEIIAAIDSTFRWGIYDRTPLDRWSTSRIALLGDAAHATTPHLGQGHNMAIEDGVVLAAVLSHSGPADTATRLHRYEDLRRGRTRRIWEISRRAGAIYRSQALTPQQQADAIAELISGDWIPVYDAAAVGARALAVPGPAH